MKFWKPVLLVSLLLIALPVSYAVANVRVTLINFYLSGTSVQVTADPPQTMIITLESRYLGQGEAQIVLTAVNSEAIELTWKLWSGLLDAAIMGQSDEGFIGEQTGGNSWTAVTSANRIIITIMGTIDWSNLEQGSTMILADLSYSTDDPRTRDKTYVPLFTFSITPESQEPSEGPKIDAAATIQELEIEISGSNLPSYRKTYYESQLYKAKLYYQNEDYNNALVTAYAATGSLRSEQNEYNNLSNVILRFFSNNALTIMMIALVAVPVIYFTRGGGKGQVVLP